MSSESIGVTKFELTRWDEVVGDPVSLLLGKQDLACELGALGPALEHLPEQLRRPDRVPTRLREQVEENVVLGD